jgi:hypothetical protein
LQHPPCNPPKPLRPDYARLKFRQYAGADHWAVDAVGAPHVGGRTEKELITAFCDKIAALSPQLVTFNGN